MRATSQIPGSVRDFSAPGSGAGADPLRRHCCTGSARSGPGRAGLAAAPGTGSRTGTTSDTTENYFKFQAAATTLTFLRPFNLCLRRWFLRFPSICPSHCCASSAVPGESLVRGQQKLRMTGINSRFSVRVLVSPAHTCPSSPAQAALARLCSAVLKTMVSCPLLGGPSKTGEVVKLQVVWFRCSRN
ncbi:uncharacterized protein LOC120507385 isoform X2 [Passer montanus]|uniref:uncharacterized protein LOC120507385 isoform X2 n=1 Tax=Passer montanus TaxID=9160 RepID=UPI0019615D22|nr:uncharacterized protein LOC120507385 isoform X2 [Passer montanus]